MKKLFAYLLLPLQIVAQTDYTHYVNPFIGTGGHGHTFPGATVPFGMVQLSPDTRLRGWDGCSGYHYSDTVIYGFSHTHLSGTGASDYGDVLLMPTVGKVQWNRRRYASSFAKTSEEAQAGYYAVFLNKPKVKAALTATTRTGLHQYIFPESAAANIILDLTHRDKVTRGAIQINGDREIAGVRISSAWALHQELYFVLQFSKPFKNFGIAKNGIVRKRARHQTGRRLKAFVQFDTEAGEAVLVRVGISPVSIDGARKNLEAEQPDFDFRQARAKAKKAWNKELGKIEVESADETAKQIFYTAFYHCMIAPNVYQDVDGNYRGRDFKVHRADSYTYHTVFSLWDTYRALHPLLTLTDTKRSNDFIQTFIKEYEQGGLLPEWELSSNETFCMIGYHAVSVIADAYLKGIGTFDTAQALRAMVHSASMPQKEFRRYYVRPPNLLNMALRIGYTTGWDSYQKRGYVRHVPFSMEVSKTLEYAYDDWCIAQMAKKMGVHEVYETFIERAANYTHHFDSTTGFMRPRKKNFLRPFDPFRVDFKYTEANAWQYSFYVPHDISGHIQLLGGKEKLAGFLDSLFAAPSKLTGFRKRDISGMIGQYVHGNEPSHQIPYEYNYVGQAWKTQAMVRRILSEQYRAQPDGLSGNEDCGQMSAWYVFSALGFYPVCPGSNQYAIGSPLFDKATIHFENGKQLVIEAPHNGTQQVYIRAATLNGKEYTKSYLWDKDLRQGGVLRLQMSDVPNKDWGTKDEDVPASRLN